ncbi:CinA family protein [Pararoseomonas indoligenes]|uniref:Nicotinamide-nucleotide amidohydrolase family protein n=1 Tax=Roseomonas indoligenes TaxID=2820811 RepID=A0A940MWK7_9PROT|nr:nicotinamide-nucleotide amidohydrolase family protein [Pararoseomonas indoligenes]MBP0492330.1 nicotinamide-nucleotide amidohydrolase family protein [Pararoseomonas indoligenes]
MLPQATIDLAATLLAALRERGLTSATAESCTGGLVAAALTAVPGSSDVVQGGFVTYSNAMKSRLLGVPEAVLTLHGAVSQECARAMAEGALGAAEAGLAIATTGIAGPSGGSAEKPVGLVYIAVARAGGDSAVRRCHFPGDRDEVRAATVETALLLALAELRAG